MPHVVSQFFDTSPYQARWHCGQWTSLMGYLHIVSDLLIFAAYLAIPLVLAYFVRRRRDIPFQRVFVLFCVFIASCGVTHFLEAIIFYWPIYPASALAKAVTAAASWLTVVALIPIIPQALSLRSPQALEQEIKERQRAQQRLAQKHRQLQEAERLKSEFFANVSHELRTPLTLILAPLESLLFGEREAHPEDQRRNLETVHNNAVRLLQMVAGLLDFSKLEAGTMEPNREPMDVVEVTRTIVADFNPAAKQRSQTLLLNSNLTECIVNLDRYLYERIVFNLISNALKFTSEGGTIEVGISHPGDQVELTVADNGIGIAGEDLGSLFQKFRQLEGSSTRRFEGTGLGLAMVKEFAELLGGGISVESKPGEGTTFRVNLEARPTFEETPAPRTTSASPSRLYPRFAVEAPAPDEAASPGGGRACLPEVLIAEDNAELGRYVASLLKRICRCRLADDGEQAARLVRERQPALILADVMMPKVDGFMLCHQLKSDRATEHIPVVLLTSLTHRDALLKGWAAGADEYLFKPFHPEELLTRVKSILGAAQARREAADVRRRSHEELARHVEERTAELVRTNESLEKEIVERAQAENRLRRNDERMRRTADSLPGLIAYVNREQRYRFANAAHESWLGIARDQIIGRTMREVLGDAGYEAVRGSVAAALGGETSAFETELSDRRGTRRYVHGVYVPSHHEDGSVRGFYVLITDITGRRAAELELQTAYRGLQQKSLEMEQFVYTVSHDLKSPLVTILGFVGVLREELAAGRLDELPDATRRIERAAYRMNELIEGLLELGRIGRVQNILERVDVSVLCRQVIADNQHVLQQAGADVEIREPLGTVLADRARLAEVFDNLLSNAIKYGVGSHESRITIGAERSGGESRFFVRDYGRGIAPEYHQKIFGLFQRMDAKSEGTGLGLAIVAKVMESHGGRAWVDSAAGRGATFWIAFPLPF